MSLVEDVKASFQAKGLKFISIVESATDPEKSTLTYSDSSGRTVTKEVAVKLSELEDTMVALDSLDPEDLANFLLK